MYKVPSARRRKKKTEPLNLVPILDCVFILIFFLLFSADFLRIREIQTDLPIVSTSSQDKPKEKELSVTVIASLKAIQIFEKWGDEEGDGKLRNSIAFTENESTFREFDSIMQEIKKKNEKLERIIFKPEKSFHYKFMVKIMDGIRQYRDEEGQTQTLFAQIMYGNLE